MQDKFPRHPSPTSVRHPRDIRRQVKEEGGEGNCGGLNEQNYNATVKFTVTDEEEIG